MTKDELIGVWGSDIYGVMEIEMVAFAADGRGWWAYSRHVVLSRGAFSWTLDGDTLHLSHVKEWNANLSEDGDIVGVFEEAPYVAETVYTVSIKNGQWRSSTAAHSVLTLEPSPVIDAKEFAPLPRLNPMELPQF